LEEKVFALVLTQETYLAREKLRNFAEDYSYSEYAYHEVTGVVFKDEKQNKAIDDMVTKAFQEFLTN
ncbi:MAG: hypothetical protein ACTSQB_06085, partial [Candidatus Heimdallarchaeota archaeon]